MAPTANNNPSPSAVTGTPSPGSRTGSPPPWTQIVRGPESDSIGAPTSPTESTDISCSDNSDNGGNAGGGKKPVWNKNGPVPVVMGPSEAWPALSASTKASPKLSSSDSSRSLPEFGSVSSLQEIGTELSSLSITPPPILSPTQASWSAEKSTTSNMNYSPVSNHGRPMRQKSMKRDGGGNPQANGGVFHQPSAAVEGSHNHGHSHSHSHGSSKTSSDGSDSSGRDNNQNHGHRDSGSQNASRDHPLPRGSYRKGGGGSHSGGDGSHQNYGGRRDQDRGNHDWNHSRSFNGREAAMQPRPHKNIVRAPPAPAAAAAFVPPAPMRPFPPAPIAVPGVSVYYYNGMPFVTPPPVFLPPVIDPQLPAKIVNQIDYYFSDDNLAKDLFLRQKMDKEGWVPIALIANFNKVKQLTEDYRQVLDSLRYSDVVEVQGDKIRQRDGWRQWAPKAAGQSSTDPNMAAQFQNVNVDEKTVDQDDPKAQLDVDAVKLLRSSSEDSNGPWQTVEERESSSGH